MKRFAMYSLWCLLALLTEGGFFLGIYLGARLLCGIDSPLWPLFYSWFIGGAIYRWLILSSGLSADFKERS